MGQVSTLDALVPIFYQLELIEDFHVIQFLTLLQIGKLVEVVSKDCGNRRPSEQIKLIAQLVVVWGCF